jgi:superfamily II DNA or RNA helicase
MSVLVNINNLSPDIIKKLNKDLIVKSGSKETKNFKGIQIPTKQVVVECFDIFNLKQNNTSIETGCIPFSYYYHHIEHKSSSVSIFNHKKLDIEFQGNLLERQKNIREEALEILNRSKSIILSLHTGFGKTIFTLYLLSKIKLKTIVLCHRSIIIDQWISSIKKYLPTTTVTVLGRKDEDKDADIMIANVINVPKKDRSFFASYGTVVVDEIHTVCTQNFSKSLLYIFPKYMIGLSATPEREDGLDRILEIFVGPEMIVRKLRTNFNIYKVNTGFEPDTKLNIAGGLDWTSVIDSQSKDKNRNQLIVNLCRYFINRNILVLVNRVEHAHLLKAILKEYNEDVDAFMGGDKICNYNSRILIATFSKGGVGFDHPKLDMLIAAGDVKANFMQYIGRIFRRDDVSPIYLDLIDSMSTMEKHSNERCNICRQLGGIVKRFDKHFPNFDTMVHLLNNSSIHKE